jgi:hypothetical protein
MNERIKYLAKQSGLSYLYDYDADGHAMVCSESDIKKLAELIVRECAELMYGRVVEMASAMIYLIGLIHWSVK